MERKDISGQLRKEYEAGMQFKQGRVVDWQDNEDLYFGKVKKSLKGRFNVPLPIMSGFIDQLLAKIDDAPTLKFGQMEETDYKAAQKLQGFYEAKKDNTDADWDTKDIDNKKLASMYGRAIFKCYGSRVKDFEFNLFITDPYDFYISPTAGGDVENADYLGEDNIFRTKAQLLAGVKAGIYEVQAVQDVIGGIKEETIINNDQIYRNKANRFSALGLNNQMYNYSAEGKFKFIESGTMIDGVRYYAFWNFDTGKIISLKPWKEKFGKELWIWKSWAPYRDAYNFWSKAPADDMRPIAETMKILANQELDNRQKTNWQMRAYDPDMFPNPEELQYRPDGLVRINKGLGAIRPIESGIYHFQTPALQGTINLVSWLDGLASSNSGMDPGADKSRESQSRVGIRYANIQETANRLGFLNKAYSKCWAAIGRSFVVACWKLLPQKTSVKILGPKGYEWNDLLKSEIDPDVDIKVVGGQAEVQADEVKKQVMQTAINDIGGNPALVAQLNPRWLVEQKLLTAGWTMEDIREATDLENFGNKELISEAAQSIEDILEGKTPKLNRGANTMFQQKIVDFAVDTNDLELKLYQKLMAYAEAHDQIVQENMMRKAMKMRAKQGMDVMAPIPGAPQSPEMPSNIMPNTPGGTMSRSQELTPQIA